MSNLPIVSKSVSVWVGSFGLHPCKGGSELLVRFSDVVDLGDEVAQWVNRLVEVFGTADGFGTVSAFCAGAVIVGSLVMKAGKVG